MPSPRADDDHQDREAAVHHAIAHRHHLIAVRKYAAGRLEEAQEQAAIALAHRAKAHNRSCQGRSCGAAYVELVVPVRNDERPDAR